MKTADDWWMWAKQVIMQEIRAQFSYNGAPPYGLKGFLDDRANRMMGYAIIRQIRTQRHNCEAPEPMDKMIDQCSGARSLLFEESKNFCAKWIYNESFPGACNWEEFRYFSAADLGTFPSTGRLGTYSGGGYILRLNGPQQKILNRMTELQENYWLDGNTRAVILEFSVYNANVNLFSINTVMAEFLDGGGIVPKWRFDPIRLIKFSGIQGTITTIAEMLFLIAIALFTLVELWKMKNQKCSYFSSYWNLTEVMILLVSYCTIGLYVYRYMLTKEALEEFNRTSGNGYVRMDSAAFIDTIFLFTTGLIVFFSTLKLIKLLQFNRRMNVLSETIAICWDELKIFLIAFAIIFFAFGCLFLFMFSSTLEDFASIIPALQTCFKMMLGKFDFQAMQRANAFSPVLFFVFSVMNSMILINIMLTIILQAFNLVKTDINAKENRLNVIDFVWSEFLQFIRKEERKRTHVIVKFTDKKDSDSTNISSGNNSDELPDKVKQLDKYLERYLYIWLMKIKKHCHFYC